MVKRPAEEILFVATTHADRPADLPDDLPADGDPFELLKPSTAAPGDETSLSDEVATLTKPGAEAGVEAPEKEDPAGLFSDQPRDRAMTERLQAYLPAATTRPTLDITA